ncbi:MAG: cation diffusion facilitator family transporter [Holosporales bacterium]|jgi:ferrous-iron efflux pump FieF|nr:cation diffusion facilitator family transporter [Holosporales bacterium]
MYCCNHQLHSFEAGKDEDRRQIKIAAYSAFGITLLLVVCRTIAYLTTRSIAVEAYMFDAVKDWVVSSLNALFLLKSVKYADEKYPFGYGKIEALAALFQSIFLFCMGAVVAFDIFHASHESKLVYSTVAFVVLGISIVGAFVLVLIQTRIARKVQSLAIQADAAHYKSDIIVNIGVLIGLWISYAASWIDVILGGVIAVYLVGVSISVGRSALAVLLDRSLAPKVVTEIRDIVEHSGGKISTIRTHSLGRGEFIALELLEDDSEGRLQDISEKHADIEAKIHERFKKSFVMIATKVNRV